MPQKSPYDSTVPFIVLSNIVLVCDYPALREIVNCLAGNGIDPMSRIVPHHA